MDSFLSLFGPNDELNTNDLQTIQTNTQYFPPEPQNSNIEYKLKLINPTKQRFQHLVTQMKWRLFEGNGQAIYKIGVEDNGFLRGLNNYEMKQSIKTIQLIAKQLNATVKELNKIVVDAEKCVKEFKIEQNLIGNEISEIRIAVFGPVDSGKSTLVGVLTQGDLDNGQGKTRLNMFQYRHEVQSGHTSSISTEILGFDLFDNVQNYRSSELMTACQIYNYSSKVITFIDLAGHMKYKKTTIYGLCGYFPEYIMLVVSTISSINIIMEQISFLIELDIKFFIIISKIDLIEDYAINEFINNFKTQLLNFSNVFEIIDGLDVAYFLRKRFLNDNVIPVIKVSNVTGTGIDILLKFLSKLESKFDLMDKHVQEKEIIFKIYKTYRLNNVGSVVAGFLTNGIIHEESQLYIGPNSEANFIPVTVNSIYRNRVRVKSIKCGQSASISFIKKPLQTSIFDELRDGMVLINSISDKQYVVYNFEAIIENNCQKLIGIKNPLMIFIENIRQSVQVLRQNVSSETFVFRFLKRPEYIRIGMKFVLCNESKFITGQIINLILSK